VSKIKGVKMGGRRRAPCCFDVQSRQNGRSLDQRLPGPSHVGSHWGLLVHVTALGAVPCWLAWISSQCCAWCCLQVKPCWPSLYELLMCDAPITAHTSWCTFLLQLVGSGSGVGGNASTSCTNNSRTSGAVAATVSGARGSRVAPAFRKMRGSLGTSC
jgi:hypothetical protein